MKFERFFMDGCRDYDGIKFRTTSEIKNPDGTVVFSAPNIEVPSNYSQVATDVIAQKYFRKAGVPKFLKKLVKKVYHHGYGVLKKIKKSLCQLIRMIDILQKIQPNKSLTDWQEPGHIGDGKVIIFLLNKMLKYILMK